MKARTAEFILTKLMGWKHNVPNPTTKKGVILGVPHTSMLDFVVSYLFARSIDSHIKVMIKKEFFFWPLGPALRAMGALPMDRANSTASMKNLIDQMKDAENFYIAICPEGTRKPIAKWKTGYHVIARSVDCPVYLGYFDWGTKTVGFDSEPFELTDNARKDTERIQAIYEQRNYVGKHPKDYITH